MAHMLETQKMTTFPGKVEFTRRRYSGIVMIIVLLYYSIIVKVYHLNPPKP